MIRIHPSWHEALAAEFEAPYFSALTDFVRAEYAAGTCYPPAGEIFAAFDRCPFPDVKVVLLGQDPYHGVGQAEGLCFSVRDGVPPPPSLQNIFKELHTDLGVPVPTSGSLRRWADQGVLLLNATLTVRAGAAGSHQGQGWETFTDAVIRTLSARREGIVFLLWGAYAGRKAALIDSARHCILTAPHPSPLSAYRGFFGSRPFSQANAYLAARGETPIQW